MTRALASFEKASPSRLIEARPAAAAAASKARLLYQPGVPVEVSEGERSKETPTVAAPKPKAAEILEARP